MEEVGVGEIVRGDEKEFGRSSMSLALMICFGLIIKALGTILFLLRESLPVEIIGLVNEVLEVVVVVDRKLSAVIVGSVFVVSESVKSVGIVVVLVVVVVVVVLEVVEVGEDVNGS